MSEKVRKCQEMDRRRSVYARKLSGNGPKLSEMVQDGQKCQEMIRKCQEMVQDGQDMSRKNQEMFGDV